MQSLYDISKELQELYEQLASGEGVDLETGEIKEEMQNAIALTENNLQSKGLDIGYVLMSFDNEIEVYENEIKRLNERVKQFKNTQTRLKNYLSNTMQQFGIESIKGKTLEIKFRKSESVEIDNELMLDKKYLTEKVETKPNKTAIKEAIKNGEKVEGARLVTNYNLQIK